MCDFVETKVVEMIVNSVHEISSQGGNSPRTGARNAHVLLLCTIRVDTRVYDSDVYVCVCVYIYIYIYIYIHM